MPKVDRAQLKIIELAPGKWRIEVSWVLAVPYWEAASWCREIVELHAGTPESDRGTVMKWTSRPWQITLTGPPEDGTYHRFSRSVSSPLVGPSVLDVAPDRYLEEIYEGSSVRFIQLTHVMVLDELYAVVAVEPVMPEAGVAASEVVTGQFGEKP